jgi:hypothetical protein
MRVISEQVGFEASKNDPAGVSKVFVVVHRLDDEYMVGRSDRVMRVFSTFEDAIEYAEVNAEFYESREYVVIEKGVY